MRTVPLCDLENQRKTNTCIAAAKESSHFFSFGANPTFRDWRFVYRARLGLSNLNGCKKPSRTNLSSVVYRKYRKCHLIETLPHIFHHCMVHSTLYKHRHNAIVKCIKIVADNRWTIIGGDRVIGTENRRLDFAVRKGNDIILDVTVPFENSNEAFDAARREKVERYKELSTEFSIDGKNAIVIGALGFLDPANDKSLRRLCSRSYLKMIKKIIVRETISFSNDVYEEHIFWSLRTPTADRFDTHFLKTYYFSVFYCILHILYFK